jgi:hypothetical protein
MQSGISRAKKRRNFRENGIFAFSTFEKPPNFRELSHSIFWKKCGQIQKRLENKDFSQMPKKKF